MENENQKADILAEMRSGKLRKKRGLKLKKADNSHSVNFIVLTVIVLVIIGGAIFTKKVADWGAGHQFTRQQILFFKVQLPYRIEEIKPQMIVSPVTERIVNEELTPIEQKIIDRFGFKSGVVALAIFDCGESGLDQYAVSHTGDLGIAQINWRTWKDDVKEKFGYNASDMFDVDKNLEVAEWVYNRDGVKESGDESWEPWSGFQNGAYTRCFK